MKRLASFNNPTKKIKTTNYSEHCIGVKECIVDVNLINYYSPTALHAIGKNDSKKEIVYIKSYDVTYTSKTPCFYDNHTFEGDAFGLPCLWDVRTNTFKIWGKFCSLECVRAYINEQEEFRKDTKLSLVAMMGRKIYGKHTQIEAAPSRYLIDTYGGPLTIEQYRSEFSSSRLWVARRIKCGLTTLVLDVYYNNSMVEVYDSSKPKKDTETLGEPLFSLRRDKIPAHLTKLSLMQMLGKKQKDE